MSSSRSSDWIASARRPLCAPPPHYPPLDANAAAAGPERRGREPRRRIGIAAAAGALTAAEELHAVADDFGGILLDAVLVGVLARLQAAPRCRPSGPSSRYSPAISAWRPNSTDAVPLGLSPAFRRSCPSIARWWRC
jgi:hypothetical protein